MNIAIIGSGNVGAALGAGWMKAGHAVVFGVRDTVSEKAARAAAALPGAVFKTVAEAAAAATVIVITTPPDAIINLLPQLGDVSGKTIIDTTNSVRVRPLGYETVYAAVKAITGSEAVVKCFNSTGFENMARPVYNGAGIDMFCAGNHAGAQAIAGQLATDLGFANCYNFGGDDKVPLLEQLALCWINLAMIQGMGRHIAFQLLKK